MKLRYYKMDGVVKQEFILTRPEQESWYADMMGRVQSNIRWYLDNLDFLPEFKVNWEDYHRKGYHKEYRAKRKAYKACNTTVVKDR